MRAAAMQLANFTRLEFPPHDGLEIADEISSARLHQQPRRINFNVFPFHVKIGSVRPNAVIGPFATDTQIVLGPGDKWSYDGIGPNGTNFHMEGEYVEVRSEE